MNAILKPVPPYVASNVSDEEMLAMLRDSTLPAYIHDWAASLESEAEGLREERDEFEADAKQRERRVEDFMDCARDVSSAWEALYGEKNDSPTAQFLKTDLGAALGKAVVALEELAGES